jgi:hypothetical protein
MALGLYGIGVVSITPRPDQIEVVKPTQGP